MARLDKERITARLNPNDTAALLKFNVKKQRIVDLCNADFQDDPFDEAKDYSSWNRALNGKEVWEGIVDAIDALMSEQTAHPRKYLPADNPTRDNLHIWMKQIAGATWWLDVLNVTVSGSAFRAWFSGRPMAKAKVDEVWAAVEQWWSKVLKACERAEFATLGRKLSEASYRENHAHGLESYFFTKVREEGMGIDAAREHYMELHDKAFRHHVSLIDLTDPVDPLSPINSKHADFFRSEYLEDFETMVSSDFPNALPSIPPNFDPEPWIETKQWGDRRQEDCPKDLNTALYGLWYRQRCIRFWDEAERRIDVDREVVEISRDGENWFEAQDVHKRGWEAGTFLFSKHWHETGDVPVNSYTRERQEIETRIRRIDAKIQEAQNQGVDVSGFAVELAASYREIDMLHLV